MTDKLVLDSTAVSPVETGADASAPESDRGVASAVRGGALNGRAFALAAGGILLGAILYGALSAPATSPARDEEDRRTAQLAINAAMERAPDAAPFGPASAAPGIPQNGASSGAPTTTSDIVVPSVDEADQPGLTARRDRDQAARQDERRARFEAAQRRAAEAQARGRAMMQSGVMVLNAADQADSAGAERVAARLQNPAPRGPSTELEANLRSSAIGRTAARVQRDRSFLIEAGRQLPCVLQTAVDSTQPGFVVCVIPENVRSADGGVVLLDKGTRVLGEYRTGIQQGQARIFVIWNRAVTPAGVSIALGSPGADALGTAGLGGETETFFWKRFGGALLISMVGDAASYGGSRVGNVNQTATVPNQAAAVALEQDVKIRPVLRARQGQEMTIFAANDFDFSDVYSLRLKR